MCWTSKDLGSGAERPVCMCGEAVDVIHVTVLILYVRNMGIFVRYGEVL